MFRRAPSVGTDDGRIGIDELLESDSWSDVMPDTAPDIPPGAVEERLGVAGEDEAAEPGEPAAGRPAFRTRLRGYDRLQVDNFVARAEWELVSARRHTDHLLDRFGACSAELEISRRLLAQTPEDTELSPVPERVGEILRLAADEASQLVDAAGAEADQLLAEARLEADARLRKAHAIKEMAVSAADELRDQARRDRAAATALLDRARIETDDLVSAAQLELAAVQEELADLRRQRDEARSSLRLLTDQIDKVLKAADPAKLVSAH